MAITTQLQAGISPDLLVLQEGVTRGRSAETSIFGHMALARRISNGYNRFQSELELILMIRGLPDRRARRRRTARARQGARRREFARGWKPALPVPRILRCAREASSRPSRTSGRRV